MASAVERTDDLVREYLIYRGFTSTLKLLDSEIKTDKEKGSRVDKIIDQLQQLIQSYDLTGLKEYWAYLDRRLFSRLEDVYRPTVNKLRTSLYRFYIIHTVQVLQNILTILFQGNTQTEALSDQTDSTNQTRVCEVGGASVEQPFIKLSQEEYIEHHSSIMHCRVDCSGRRVASLDVDGVVKVWAFNPIMQTKATIMSKSPLLSLEWAAKPDRLLLLGSGVGTVKLYDTDAKKNLYEMTIDNIHPRILSLACSPSGTSFVCSAAAPAAQSGVLMEGEARVSPPVSGQLLLWDTKTVKQQLQFALEPGPVAINCTAFNHNGNLLVTGAADGMIRLFDMQRYESALSWKAHDGEVYSVEFSYDENTVFSIGEDGKFVQWNIHRSGVKESEYLLSQDAVGPFVLSGYSGYKQVQVPRGRLFAFDSEGKHVLTCSSNGGNIYRLNKADVGLESVLCLGGHKAPVVTVDWCSAMDCGICLTASMDGKIKLSTLLAQKP
uniref:WD repeat-containing protein 91 n=1 Tax=Cyprinus carpio TaxID=7962 RepID=A0A8C2PYY5_CYPCA